MVGLVIDSQAHFHSSCWEEDGFLSVVKITRTQNWGENLSSCQPKNKEECTRSFLHYCVCCPIAYNKGGENKICIFGTTQDLLHQNSLDIVLQKGSQRYV